MTQPAHDEATKKKKKTGRAFLLWSHINWDFNNWLKRFLSVAAYI